MQILFILALVVLGAGVVQRVGYKNSPAPSNVLATFVEPTPTIPTPSPSPLPNPSPTSTPSIPRITPPTVSWQYPGSHKLSDSEYESDDNSQKITDWYKEKIKALGYGAKSFIQTKTNGLVVNKLIAVGKNDEVSVEISKNANESRVKIKVLLDN